MLKEMKVVWDKFQDQKLSLDDVTEEEVLSLKTSIEKMDSKDLTEEEKEVKELLQGADLKMHKAVVARLYDIFVYV